MFLLGAAIATAAATDSLLEASGVTDYLPQVTVQVKVEVRYTPARKRIQLPRLGRPSMPKLPTLRLPSLPSRPVYEVTLPESTKRVTRWVARARYQEDCRKRDEREAKRARVAPQTFSTAQLMADQFTTPPAPDFPQRALTRKEISQVLAPDITTNQAFLPTDREWAMASARPAPLTHGGDLQYESIVQAQGKGRASAKRMARASAKARRDAQDQPRPRRYSPHADTRPEYGVPLFQDGVGFGHYAS